MPPLKRFPLVLLLMSFATIVMTVTPISAQQSPESILATYEDIAIQIQKDNSTRLITYYDGENRRSIPYPEGVTEITVASLLSPDPLMVISDTGLWKLDPAAGSLTPYPVHCGEAGIKTWGAFLRRPDASSFVYDYEESQTDPFYPYDRIDLPVHPPMWGRVEIEGRIYPCSMATGELVDPLPEQMRWGSQSPDGRYLVLYQETDPERYLTLLYSYEIESGRLLVLDSPRFRREEIIGWVTPTQFLASFREAPEWSVTNVYSADVTVPHSFREIISRTRLSPVLFPDHLETYSGLYRDGPAGGDCTLTIYEFESRETSSYNTGSLCDPGLIIPNGGGDRLYRMFYPAAGVVRFNPFTGEREILFTGEVEDVLAVSPTGRYAVVVLDSNLYVDIPQDPDPNTSYATYNAQAFLFDIATHQFVYHLVGVAWQLVDLYLHKPQITWINEQTLIMNGAAFDGQFLTIEQGQITRTSLPGNLRAHFGRWLVLETADHSMILYQWKTGEQRPLINAHDENDYSFRFAPVGDQSLLVEIYGAEFLTLLVTPRE